MIVDGAGNVITFDGVSSGIRAGNEPRIEPPGSDYIDGGPGSGTLLFSYWFSEMPNVAVPWPMRDFSTFHDQALREDVTSVIDGGLGQVTFNGQEYTVATTTLTTGWRSGIAMDTSKARVVITSLTDLSVSNAQGGAGVVCFDPATKRLGISNWLNPFGFYETGYIGNLATDFEYADMFFLNPSMLDDYLPDPGELSVTRLYVADDEDGDWWVWATVNGHLLGGPIALPPELVGCTWHGAQLDVGSNSQTVSNFVGMACHEYLGPVPGELPPPTVLTGVISSGVGATSTAVAVPTGLQIGDRVILTTAADVTISTPSGFTAGTTGSVTSPTVNVKEFIRVIDGTEPWVAGPTYTLAHPSGNCLAQMSAIRDFNPWSPIQSNVNNDSVSDTSSSLTAISFAGPHRAGLAHVVAGGTVTVSVPSGWSMTQLSAGGLTMALLVVADWDESPPLTLTQIPTTGPPIVNGGWLWSTGAQAITFSGAAKSVSVHRVIMPNHDDPSHFGDFVPE